MNSMLRKALRKYSGLRNQVENVLLGEDGETWEAELKKFLAKRECWTKGKPSAKRKPALADWTDFYEKHFGLELGQVVIPAAQADFTRLIVVAKGIMPNWVYDACAKQFPCYRYADDLDKSVTKNDRDSKDGAYAILVRDVVEADEVHRNKSANDLAEAGIKGITLLERMLFELKYFDETGKHLDIENWTLCSGSRDSVGGVPGAIWDDGRFGVDWCLAVSSSASLRSREAVVA